MVVGKWSILLLSLACSAVLAAEPLALKGVAVGEPANQEQLLEQLGFSAHNAVTNGKGCIGLDCGHGWTTLGGVRAEIFVGADTQARITAIHAIFPATSFADVDAALRAKYGTPQGMGEQTRQSLMGARFQVVTEWWTDDVGNKLSLTSHADATRGYLLLQSKSELDRQAAQKVSAKGDI